MHALCHGRTDGFDIEDIGVYRFKFCLHYTPVAANESAYRDKWADGDNIYDLVCNNVSEAESLDAVRSVIAAD